MGSSKNRQTIREAIQDIGKADKVEVFSGEVESVDEAEATIDVRINEDIIVYGVRLRCVIDTTDGMYIVPAIDSHVVFAQIDGGQDYQLIQASVIDKVMITIEGTTVVIDKDGIVFNEGTNDGLVNVVDLVTKLNNLENKVNIIATTFNSHTHSGVTSGGQASGPSPTPITGTLTPTQKADIEDTKITH